MTRNITSALRPLSPAIRRAVRDVLLRHGQPVSGPLNADRRIALERALFAVQDDLEHRRHGSPQVDLLVAVRNILLDEVPASMGGNETHTALRWSHLDAPGAVMAERRRKGRANAFVVTEPLRAAS